MTFFHKWHREGERLAVENILVTRTFISAHNYISSTLQMNSRRLCCITPGACEGKYMASELVLVSHATFSSSCSPGGIYDSFAYLGPRPKIHFRGLILSLSHISSSPRMHSQYKIFSHWLKTKFDDRRPVKSARTFITPTFIMYIFLV